MSIVLSGHPKLHNDLKNPSKLRTPLQVEQHLKLSLEAGTIHRRIIRRMAMHQIETMDGYVKYLQKSPQEVEALFRDLLIGVTSFSRSGGLQAD